jgi:hypothetical protein
MNSSAAAGSGTAWGIFGGICAAPSATANVFLLYNTETNLCSTTPFQLGVWSGGAPLITARRYIAGAGTANAALAAGGSVPPTTVANTEEYNGSAWAAGGTLINAISNHTGVGTQNAALSIGGYAPGSPPHSGGSGVKANTEEYNGTAWSNGGALGAGMFEGASTGTQNAAIVFGGRGPAPFADTNCTRHYDGSAWTAGGNLIAACSSNVGSGIENAALNINGTTTEEYNGTTWASGTALITARCTSTAAGTQNDSILYGGCVGSGTIYGNTERYNGISWSQEKQMNVPRKLMGISCLGTSNSALAVGGTDSNNDVRALTEEYTYGDFCAGTWSSGGMKSTCAYVVGGAGVKGAAAAFGGSTYPTVASATEEYDGSTWSAGGALIIARGYSQGFGTQDAAVLAGGLKFAVTGETEEYNGSAWTAVNSMITGRGYSGSTGAQSAGLVTGGENPTCVTCTEEYNGLTWAAGGALPQSNNGLSAAGSQNATVTAGGYAGAAARNASSLYNGTSWTVGNTLITARAWGSAYGTQNDANFAGGGPSTLTESFNGVVWSTANQILQTKYRGGVAGGGGNTSASEGGLIFNGSESYPGNTEEFTCINPVSCGLQCFWNSLSYTTT